MNKELPYYYSFMNNWWYEHRHVIVEGMSRDDLQRLTIGAIKCALTLLRNDLVLMAKHGQYDREVVYQCPVDVRGRGLCILINDIHQMLQQVIPESVLGLFHNNVVASTVWNLLGQFENLLISRKLNTQFPINIPGCAMIPCIQYSEFSFAVNNRLKFDYFAEYALARTALIDDVLSIIHNLEGESHNGISGTV